MSQAQDKRAYNADARDVSAYGGDVDWTRTSLGPMDGWPKSLINALNLCLALPLPALVAWEEEAYLLPNSAFRVLLERRFGTPIVGTPAAAALREAWHRFGPIVEQVRRTGLPTTTRNVSISHNDAGVRRRHQLDLSFSPIQDEQFMNTGVLCIATERALPETARYAERQRQLADASLAINASSSLSEMLRMITERVRVIIGAHQAVTSFTVGEDWSQSISSISLSDKYARWRTFDAQPTGAGIYALVCQHNRPLRLTQAELEAHFAWRGYSTYAAEHPPLRGWLAVPLIGRDGQNIGLIQLSDKSEGDFVAEDESIAVQLAQMASVAIENVRLYQATEAAVHVRDELLSGVSHDLKNPLSVIAAHSELLERRLARLDNTTAERLRNSVLSIRTAAGKMTTQINELLDTARLQAGQPLELQLERVDLVALARLAAEEAQQTTSNHTITVAPMIEEMTGCCDQARLERVLANLLSNAIKYSPAGGEIQIVIRHTVINATDWGMIEVHDHGLGIPPADLPNIFNRFHRAGNVAGVVRQIVEQHNGTVGVSSTEGVGSTFVVRLPLDC
jgi:signal transduction histidine kinase